MDVKENPKIAVYTAITGGKDKLLDPEYKDDGVDYFCYCDDVGICNELKHWTAVEIPRIKSKLYVDQAKHSKYYRIMTHKMKELQEYDILLYVDGNQQIKESIIPLINELGDCKLMACRYERKKGIYAEIADCIIQNKDYKGILERQRNFYLKEGYPKENRNLWVLGMLVRKNKDVLVDNFNELWYEQIKNFSNRAQIGFPYAVWKTGINVKTPGTCTFIGAYTKYFIFHKHLIKSTV
jgi:hypothetical protein